MNSDKALAKAITDYKAAVHTGQLPEKVSAAKTKLTEAVQHVLDGEAA